MPNFDYRPFVDPAGGAPDFLLRSAVSSFVALTRPTRGDARRLFDLAEPLIPLCSDDALRFAAAALSDSRHAPRELVLVLAALPVAVSAAIVVRSPLLMDSELVSLIGRMGVEHARAVARRRDIGPMLRLALRGMGDREVTAILDGSEVESTAPAVERARDRLRAIMAETETATGTAPPVVADPYARLLETALSGQAPLFQTALADALLIGFAEAVRLSIDEVALSSALAGLGLPFERAFLILSAFRPGRFRDAAAIRLLMAEYRDRADLVAPAALPAPANRDEPVAPALRSA